jgi:uncharacterized membrane protein YeaQ/YmgE (transglycosylase-associated protein family)
MDVVGIFTSLVSGAIGGNIAGAIFKKLSLGGWGNTAAGIIGGGVGGSILNSMLGSNGITEGLFGNIFGSAIGGAVLLLVVGAIRNSMLIKPTETGAKMTNTKVSTSETPVMKTTKTSPTISSEPSSRTEKNRPSEGPRV